MATIRDIAERLSLSASTVSLALRGDERVHPTTRDRVTRTAAQLGYVRNHAATSLSSGRSLRVELVANLDAVGGGFFTAFIRGAHAVLHPRGYSLTLSALTGAAEAATHLERLRAGSAIDAVLLTNPTVHDELPERVARELPIVVLGRPAGTNHATRVDNDNPRVGADIIHHLRHLQHQRVLVLEPHGFTFTEDRVHGMLEAWQGHAQPAATLRRRPVGAPAAPHLSDTDLESTAVVCMSDTQAAFVLQELRARGLRVPEDVSVLGMNDDLAALLEPALTSVDFDAPALGIAAARAVLHRLDGDDAPPLTVVPHALQVRRSTAEARSR